MDQLSRSPDSRRSGRYVWLDHDRQAPTVFRLTSDYWSSRGRAMAWSAAYSLQFEIDLLSEVLIGNVGLEARNDGMGRSCRDATRPIRADYGGRRTRPLCD